MEEFNVDNHIAGQRVDIFVAEKHPQYARSSLKGLFANQQVLVNDKTAKAGYKLRAGDRVVVDTALISAETKPIKLSVIYEDSNVVVINKPAGILTHAKGALNLEPTIASFLSGKITDKQMSGNRAGIVHRLDRLTSGVVIGAKTHVSLKWLQSQFSKRKVKKTYLAIVEGELKPQAAIIDAPIGRNPKRPQTFRVSVDGKPAQTKYQTLKSFQKNNTRFSLLELQPITGRTHQLRVHLAYIGHPVAGDIVYGPGSKNGQRTMYLHAHKLELTLPDGHRHEFIAPVPKYFEEFHA
jgi:23S rRNA pseudouridine1911/1915/1917 synthase